MEGCTVCMYLCDIFPPVIAPPCVADPPLFLPCFCVCNRATLPPFGPQVPASVDRRAGDLPHQPGCDRADLFQLRPAAPVPHLLPPGERTASAGRRLPVWVSDSYSANSHREIKKQYLYFGTLDGVCWPQLSAKATFRSIYRPARG